MYSINGYGKMIADRVRMAAYLQALRQVVKPDAIVVDIGAGTGIFSLLACQLGAKRVYAIEPDEAIQVARELAVANGYADRIEFIQAVSTEISLPEQTDIVISDLRGILPLWQTHIPSIVDLRQRFIAPGGTLIPQHDTLWAAIVEAPETYQNLVEPWGENHYGLQVQPARRITANQWCKAKLLPEQLLTEPQCWAELNYLTVEDPNVRAEITCVASRPGTGYGIGLWFETVLLDGIGFSNAPAQPQTIYGQAFFPWLQPVLLMPEDLIQIKLSANLVGDEYIWRWQTVVRDRAHPTQIKADFQQTTFWGQPLSLSKLRQRSDSAIPKLNLAGQIQKQILTLMDGQYSSGEIAHQLVETFPDRFKTWEDALNCVIKLTQTYSY